MKLTCEQKSTTTKQWIGWHILTVAEAGFSMLGIYGRQHGIDTEALQQFADRINLRDEAGSLHPHAPISAVPMRFFRMQEKSSDIEDVEDLKCLIRAFLEANNNTIHAQRLLVDFHVSPAAVPTRYIVAAEEVLRMHGQDSIQEVVIFK